MITTRASTVTPGLPIDESSSSISSIDPEPFNNFELSSLQSSDTSAESVNQQERILNKFLSFGFGIVMNAAITIFGVGIGVGLILADSFRPSNTSSSTGTSTASNIVGTSESRSRNEVTVAVSAATPNCRATIRRAMDRIQEAPPLNLASMAQLPAQ
jgi:hypothetical protein